MIILSHTEESYNYDAAGNITSCIVSSGSNTFVYDLNSVK